MNRRGFFGALAGLPMTAVVQPKPEQLYAIGSATPFVGYLAPIPAKYQLPYTVVVTDVVVTYYPESNTVMEQ